MFVPTWVRKVISIFTGREMNMKDRHVNYLLTCYLGQQLRNQLYPDPEEQL